jgi:hypothetical protein
MISLKKCTKCGEEKSATTEFWHRNPRGKYGLLEQCKVCRRGVRMVRTRKPRQLVTTKCETCCQEFMYLKYKRTKRYCSDTCIPRDEAKRKITYNKWAGLHPERMKEIALRSYYKRMRLNPEKFREYSKKYAISNPEKRKRYRESAYTKMVGELRDSYIRCILRQQYEIELKDIQPEWIQAKRSGIKTHRLIKKLKKQTL